MVFNFFVRIHKKDILLHDLIHAYAPSESFTEENLSVSMNIVQGRFFPLGKGVKLKQGL